MSQQKVDYKKDLKKDRKKILKKQRMERIAITIGGVAVFAVLAVWLGFSAYDKYQEAEAAKAPTYASVDLSAITDYLSGVEAEDTDAE